MAYEESIRSITLNADSSLAVYTGVPGQPGSADPNGGNQYRFVKVTGAHQCGRADADDTVIVGVLQNKPQREGNAATVAIRGVSKVVAAEAIEAGDLVYCSADGRATDTAGAGSVCGIALSTVAAAGELVSVLLNPALA
jgi:predicted RecA/RadA family phage recombinase